MLSTRKVRLGVARSVIFASNVPRCASGKTVLGAELIVRLEADGPAVLPRGWTIPGKGESILGFRPSAETADAKVKGSMGCGVSAEQFISERRKTRTLTIQKLYAIYIERIIFTMAELRFPEWTFHVGYEWHHNFSLLV